MNFNFFAGIKNRVTLQRGSIPTYETTLKNKKIEKLEPLTFQETITDEMIQSLLEKMNNLFNDLSICLMKLQEIPNKDFKSSQFGIDASEQLKKSMQKISKATLYLEASTEETLRINYHSAEKILQNAQLDTDSYREQIEEHYQMNVVDSNYHFDSSKEMSKWRKEAAIFFPGVDTTSFTDSQLKEYVVAAKNMPESISTIQAAMNPDRSAEHVRLLFNCLDDKTFVEVFQNPSYTVDKIHSLMPDIVSLIEEERKK